MSGCLAPRWRTYLYDTTHCGFCHRQNSSCAVEETLLQATRGDVASLRCDLNSEHSWVYDYMTRPKPQINTEMHVQTMILMTRSTGEAQKRQCEGWKPNERVCLRYWQSKQFKTMLASRNRSETKIAKCKSQKTPSQTEKGHRSQNAKQLNKRSDTTKTNWGTGAPDSLEAVCLEAENDLTQNK